MIGAETHVGEIDFALNQALSGPSIYDEYLARRGEGLHHIACMSGEPGGGLRVRDRFAAAGIGVAMGGTIDGAVEFFYFDTEPVLGVAVESGSGHAIGLPPDRVFPSDGASASARAGRAALAEISVVVADLDAAAQSYTRLLGWGPWDAREVSVHGRRNGTPVEYTAATARTQVGPVKFEIVQPGPGPSVERGTLDGRGSGLHHVSCALPPGDADRVRDLLDERGIGIDLGGTLDGVDFWYLDTVPRLKLLLAPGPGPSRRG